MTAGEAGGAAGGRDGARHCHVRVPASSANLGPGFDVLAAALSLHLELEVVHTGTFAVQTELRVRRDRGNLAVRAFERLHPADEFEFRISSEIPLSGGLGSSAAAIVSGLLAAEWMSGAGGADILALAGELEGHSDNVAAALDGGFVVTGASGVHRLEPPPGLEAVLVVPHVPVRTAQARAALPAQVPLADATFNLARLATLTLGLARGDLELVAAGLDDQLHQPYRAHLFPRSAELLERAVALGALGATISGAGPAVLVWVAAERAAEVTARVATYAEGWADVTRASFESTGASVSGIDGRRAGFSRHQARRSRLDER